MKFKDLHDFIMENIPEEEWRNFYEDESGLYENALQNLITNDGRRADVLRMTRGLVCFKSFDVPIKGEGWRKQFFKVFFDDYDLKDKDKRQNNQEFREKVIDFLLCDYLYSVGIKNIYKEETMRIAKDLLGEMPKDRRSYKGSRKSMAVHPEYWVRSSYDIDENVMNIAVSDERFEGDIENIIAFDVVVSIRDFLKQYNFIGVTRKVA